MADKTIFKFRGVWLLLMTVQAPTHIHPYHRLSNFHVPYVAMTALAVHLPLHHVDLVAEIYEAGKDIHPDPGDGLLSVPII
jgi:hypothetical protein